MLVARVSKPLRGRCAPANNFSPVPRQVTARSSKEAPELAATLPSGENGSSPSPRKPPGNNGPSFNPKRLIRQFERKLSNLQFAILELAVLAALSGVGTVIEQEQTLEWYQTNFPDGPRKVLGFLDYNWIFALQLDHIYTSNYFLGISALLTASLIACSRTQQWPIVRIAKRWKFLDKEQAIFAKGNGETLPSASVRDLGALLKDSGYEVFLKNGSLYGFKGISGRFAPIAVHVSLVLILFGAAVGALGGLDGQVMIPEGGEFLVASRLRGGITTLPGLLLPEGASKVVRLDKFSIDYRPDGSVGQYRSVLTESDLQGRMEQQKEIYVNEPMRFGGITIYQTDWAISSMMFRVAPADGGGVLAAPAAQVGLTEIGSKLGMNSSSKLYGTFIPLEVTDGTRAPRGISVLARDLQQVVFYDPAGQFVGVRRPGSNKPIDVAGFSFVVDDLIGASGVQLKHDPGIGFVYTGFGFLMITTLISYISHSQVWALQDGEDLHVGGRTNRATVTFAAEYASILDSVPERPPPPPPPAAAVAAAAAGGDPEQNGSGGLSQ